MSTSGRSVSVEVAAAALLHSGTCIKCFLSVFVLSLSLSLPLSLSLLLVSNHLNFHTCAVFFSLFFNLMLREGARERSVTGVDVGWTYQNWLLTVLVWINALISVFVTGSSATFSSLCSMPWHRAQLWHAVHTGRVNIQNSGLQGLKCGTAERMHHGPSKMTLPHFAAFYAWTIWCSTIFFPRGGRGSKGSADNMMYAFFCMLFCFASLFSLLFVLVHVRFWTQPGCFCSRELWLLTNLLTDRLSNDLCVLIVYLGWLLYLCRVVLLFQWHSVLKTCLLCFLLISIDLSLSLPWSIYLSISYL